MLALVGEAHDGRFGRDGDRLGDDSGALAGGEPERRGEVRRRFGDGSSISI